MISQQISDLLNSQLNKELHSAYLYMDMADYFSDIGLDGFASWFFVQTQEERDHAMFFRTFMLEQDVEVKLEDIKAPAGGYKDTMDILQQTLKHEQFITDSINTIYATAAKENNFLVMQFLNWFIKEQGEEEATATDLIRKYELFGGDAKSLYLLDQELAARVYAAPTTTP